MKIYFVTSNKGKIKESRGRVKRFIDDCVQKENGFRPEIEIVVFKKHLDELLDPDVEKIVRKKALDAYRIVRQPCVVEHGGLFLDAWRAPNAKRGLLGGIGQVVWDAVGEQMCRFLTKEDVRTAEAQSVVGYCDGRRIKIYPGSAQGEVTTKKLGTRGFRWDPIFKPAGSKRTYGQMTPNEKRKTSPEEKAWTEFLKSVAEGLEELRKS